MMTAPSTWTLVLVPSPTAGSGYSAPLPERLATHAGLLLLAWAERRRDCVRRAISLDGVARTPAAPRPFC
jgi:hypothetical protein